MWWRKENYNRYPWMMMYRFFHRNHQRNSKNILEQCKRIFFCKYSVFIPLPLICIPDMQLVCEYTISMGCFKPVRSCCHVLNTETYLKLWQTSLMELLCKLNERLLAIGYFWKKAPSQMFDSVLNMTLEEANYW